MASSVVEKMVEKLRKEIQELHPQQRESFLFADQLETPGPKRPPSLWRGLWQSPRNWKSEVLVRRYSITVHLTLINCGTRFFVTNVYGPASWDGKEDFYTELRLLKDCCKGKWILCGDFNSTRSQNERKGKTWSSRATNLFNTLIKELELIDLSMANQSFTWSNLQSNPTLARLDRFLVSTEWELEFPLSKVDVKQKRKLNCATPYTA
uniref:Endonuclease/exonuclease/phosphatase domain-containing protein n=1 Tax=Ananas comosus var. bracteatus TaxID=296719 RepID=A0A6V7PNZ9_ANACO|nr:unnamed protein product [Ananas comosus var. bracteatus]